MDSKINVNLNQQISGLGSSRKSEDSLSISAKDSSGGFANTLNDAINKVNDLQVESDIKTEALATGKSNNLHETMISVEKADIALRLMVQVRNKMIDAYQEIMKMQV